MSSSLTEKWVHSGLLDDAENVESLAESLESAYQHIAYLNGIGVEIGGDAAGMSLPAIRRIHDEIEGDVDGADVVESLHESMIYLKKETEDWDASALDREAEMTDLFVDLYTERIQDQ